MKFRIFYPKTSNGRVNFVELKSCDAYFLVFKQCGPVLCESSAWVHITPWRHHPPCSTMYLVELPMLASSCSTILQHHTAASHYRPMIQPPYCSTGLPHHITASYYSIIIQRHITASHCRIILQYPITHHIAVPYCSILLQHHIAASYC